MFFYNKYDIDHCWVISFCIKDNFFKSKSLIQILFCVIAKHSFCIRMAVTEVCLSSARFSKITDPDCKFC